MEKINEISRTSAEKRLAAALIRKNIIFKQNQTIAGYEVDFWFPDYSLIVEVDGYTHLSAAQQLSDQQKDQQLIDKGFVVIRINNQEIRNDLNKSLKSIETIIHKLKAYRSKGTINNDWKNVLKKLPITEVTPQTVIRTIEDYFLSIENKPD